MKRKFISNTATAAATAAATATFIFILISILLIRPLVLGAYFPTTPPLFRFHNHLGRLDADEGRTRLYQAIGTAATRLQEYKKQELSRGNISGEVAMRVFVLTDGQDNGNLPAWLVTRDLQQAGVVLDAIPVAGPNTVSNLLPNFATLLCLLVIMLPSQQLTPL